jgi:pseudouridine-5'-monophosphatase
MATSTHPPSKLPAIRATLFDMDGLLIDSEDLYTLCTNTILARYGKDPLPWDIKAKLQGRPGPAASNMLQEWAQLPISMDDFLEQTQVLQEQTFPRTQPLPGVVALIERLKSLEGKGTIEIAVATSSHARNFELKTSHLQDLFSHFDAKHTVKGDDPRIPKGRGKPAPDIFLLALQLINETRKAAGKDEIHPEECLVFEDSVPGVEAGRRAGMQVAWVPHEGLRGVYSGREAEVLAGATGEHVDDGSSTAEWEKKRNEWVEQGRQFARVRGAAGDLDDGWGRMYDTLEGFPLNYYGLEG